MPEFTMHPRFMTEKEVEGYLEPETRVIPWLDGQDKHLTEMKIFWSAYDFLVDFNYYTPQALVALAVTNQQETGGTFEDNFHTVVSYAAKVKRG